MLRTGQDNCIEAEDWESEGQVGGENESRKKKTGEDKPHTWHTDRMLFVGWHSEGRYIFHLAVQSDQLNIL